MVTHGFYFFDVIMLVYITPPAPASAQSPSRTRPAHSVSPDKKADPSVPGAAPRG